MNKCIVYNQKPISRGKNKWHIIIIGIVRRAADRLTEIHGDRRHRREMADRLIRDHGDRHRRGLADRLIRDRGDRRHRREMPRLCPSGRVCETEKTAESEDLYMADMQEPGQMEEDWLYMKQLYPNTARKLMTYIEDAADRLEYENSLMFDAYPDRIAVEQVVKEIIAVVQENEPTLLVMPESENGQNEDQTWSSCVEEIIQMILLGEMHHRRWRYQQMNRRNY